MLQANFREEPTKNNRYLERKQLYTASPEAAPAKGGNSEHKDEFSQPILKNSMNNLNTKSALT